MSLLLGALACAALAGDIDPSSIRAVGDGAQSITVLITDLDGRVKPRVEHLGQGLSVDAQPIGEGTQAATLRVEPRRFAHLQVTDTASTPPTVLYSGLLTLPDQDAELVAFRYRSWTAQGRTRTRLSRVPLVPYTRTDLDWGDQPVVIASGVWGGLVLLYAGLMAGLFLARRRT